MNSEKRYEVVINTAVNTLRSFSIIGIIVLIGICIINRYFQIPKAWNISFIIPMFVIFIGSIIELVICFWNTGKNYSTDISKVCSRKSGLLFASCITFISFIATFMLYTLLVIILY